MPASHYRQEQIIRAKDWVLAEKHGEEGRLAGETANEVVIRWKPCSRYFNFTTFLTQSAARSNSCLDQTGNAYSIVLLCAERNLHEPPLHAAGIYYVRRSLACSKSTSHCYALMFIKWKCIVDCHPGGETQQEHQ